MTWRLTTERLLDLSLADAAYLRAWDTAQQWARDQLDDGRDAADHLTDYEWVSQLDDDRWQSARQGWEDGIADLTEDDPEPAMVLPAGTRDRLRQLVASLSWQIGRDVAEGRRSYHIHDLRDLVRICRDLGTWDRVTILSARVAAMRGRLPNHVDESEVWW